MQNQWNKNHYNTQETGMKQKMTKVIWNTCGLDTNARQAAYPLAHKSGVIFYNAPQELSWGLT